MDPDAALRELRSLAKDVIACEGDQAMTAVFLAEHFIALDEWIEHGGFLPGAWHQVPDA